MSPALDSFLTDNTHIELALSTSCARFGHHPSPAVDYCIEVDQIMAIAYDCKTGLASSIELRARFTTAISFVPGGDLFCILAKNQLRLLGLELGL